MTQRAYSPKDIARIRIKELPLEGKWQESFGLPSRYDTWFISGQSASGKSAFSMQLSKELCRYGYVLYISLEEGVGKTFKDRMARERMDEVQGRFRVITDSDIDALKARLKKPRSGNFIIVDSIQYSEWLYPQIKDLVDSFPRRCFIFISQEYRGKPMGKGAERVRYMAGVKVRTIGFKAFCQGRSIGSAAAPYTIWEEGVIATSNNKATTSNNKEE